MGGNRVIQLARNVIRWFKHRVLEGRIYATELCIRNGPKLVLLPSHPYLGGGGSSALRAIHLARYLDRLGWHCTVVPAQLDLTQRLRIIRSVRPDLLFVQQGTHPLNRHDLTGGIPYVFDIDDAYFLDAAYTTKFAELCEHASCVIAASHRIASWCSLHNPNVTVVWTATAFPGSFPVPSPSQREPIVIWPHHFRPEHNAAERALFAEIIELVRRETPFHLWFLGVVDPSGAADVLSLCEARGIPFRMWPNVSYDRYIQLAAKAAVGLDIVAAESQYNAAKSFGKVLAYLRAGTPVVATNVAEYPRFFESGMNGFLVDSPQEWRDAIVNLLTNPCLRDTIARNAWEKFRRELSFEASASKIDQTLRDVLDHRGL